jgi:glycosyltransferase involved in cell wall biosynthesis
MNVPRFSIILPCYNEAGTIPSLFARFAEVIGARQDVEVIFVNNGSKDESAAVMAREQEESGRGFARVVQVAVNHGYGYGISAGLQEARGEYIGWTHADSQYDPAIVLEGFRLLVGAAEPGRTFLQGYRINRNWFDSFFTAGMTLVARLMLGTDVRDINAQPKLFPRSFLAQMRNPPNDFSLDLYALFLARRQGYNVLFLPVVFGQRLHGEAKGGGSLALKWKLTRRTWAFISQLRCDIHAGRI